jgi:hypothetical protein
MSVKIMTLVFERYPNGGGEMLLALALADHAHDDGRYIFPSIRTLANKTRQSERTVQRFLRGMTKAGWLIPVKNAFGGRGKAAEYRISPDWIKGDNLTPFQKMGVKSSKKTVKNEVIKGDTAMSPQPSDPLIEPSSSSWIEEEGYTNEEIKAAAYQLALSMRAKSPHMYVSHVLQKAALGDEGTRENLRAQVYTTQIRSVNIFDLIEEYYGEEQQ